MDFFENLAIDQGQMAHATDLTIARDVATFHLENGTLAPFMPFSNRVIGFVFTGTGKFTFTPPIRVEKEQLQRYYGVQTFAKEFNSLCVLFGDTTWQELQSGLVHHEQQPSDEMANTVDEMLKFISDSKHQYFDTDLLQTFLNHKHNNHFYAFISLKNSDPFFLRSIPITKNKSDLCAAAGEIS